MYYSIVEFYTDFILSFTINRGDDFRESYRHVGNIRSFVTSPVLALTATCTEKMRLDIFENLALDEETRIVSVLPNRYVFQILIYNTYYAI